MTTVEHLTARHRELESKYRQADISEERLTETIEALGHLATEIARAPVERASDLHIKARLLERRLRESMSPEHSGDVVDHMLACSIVDALAD
ncbi:hypothetical protein [Parvibaculum sp.]|uniref:hypothetical protein n=1 Tax=Parvibaculum sp. TaxID=2024848 RepID=UPI001D3C1421|nr:hypothetical protein [Parvibaculum sp.]MBX3488945.1 hypothetical protein [Parvibaculum sp.]